MFIKFVLNQTRCYRHAEYTSSLPKRTVIIMPTAGYTYTLYTFTKCKQPYDKIFKCLKIKTKISHNTTFYICIYMHKSIATIVFRDLFFIIIYY